MAASPCVDMINTVAPQMKHSSFAAEKEWRLITIDRVSGAGELQRTSKMELFFRPSADRLVPYLHFPIPTRPIREIVVGHSNSMTPNDSALWLFWRQTIGGTPNFNRSEVPVR